MHDVPSTPRTMSRLSSWGWLAVRALAAAAVAACCGWMLWHLANDDRLQELRHRRFDAVKLAASIAASAAAQLLYFARWPVLARVLGVPLGRLEAMLAAATAQLLGSLAFGAAATDIFRAVANAGKCAGHRVGLVASILADRVSGLYALVCLAAVAAVTARDPTAEWSAVRAASLPALWIAVVLGGACVWGGLFVNLGPVLAATRRLPIAHGLIVRVVSSLERFRSAPAAIAFAVAAGIVVHALNAVSMWLLADGLSLPNPSLAAHFLILPLAACTGLLPLPFAGLGAVEMIVDRLYAAALPDAAGSGLLVFLTLRILSLGINGLLVAVLAVATRCRAAIGRGTDAVS